MLTLPDVSRLSLVTWFALAGCAGAPSAEDVTAPASSVEVALADGRGSERMDGWRGREEMVTVPIRGVWANTESPPSANPPAGCLIHIETRQTGHATHLGRFDGVGRTCVTSQVQADSPPFWDHDPAPPYGVMDFANEMVWTAANGDELWLRPNGGVFVLSFANGAASVRGHLTIAGGTGRFEGATGRLEVTGGREAGEPGDRLEYEGDITMRPGAASK